VDENGKTRDDPHVLARALLLVAAAAVGCQSTATPSMDASQPSSLNANGCFDGNNGAGIVGCWYSYGSTVTTPVPGQPFPSMNGSMCTSGTAAKVIDTASAAVWGAGIGFDLNNAGAADGGPGEKLPWDATAHDVTGFAFHVDRPPVGGQLRVELPTSAAVGTTDVKPAYWGGATANLSPVNVGGDYAFHFTDVGGPSDLAAPTPFDKTKILSMQFHVVSNTTSVIPFDYCISNVRALKD
jgi:hypothetical protein